MICLSLQYRDINEIYEAIEDSDAEMAEICLDTCELSMDDIEELFTDMDIPLIASYKIKDKQDVVEAEAKLTKAIVAGAIYVDLDINAPAMMSKRIRRQANEYGTYLIRSYHNYDNTDSLTALNLVIDSALKIDADIIKIVTTATSTKDCDIIAKLYDNHKDISLVAFCMGDYGRQSRIDCLKYGAPFTYSCLNYDEATAPGQFTYTEMVDMVYGQQRGFGYKTGEISLPCSKSFAQRSIVFASLAKGCTHISNYAKCSDNESAINFAKQIGAKVERKGSVLNITGIDAIKNCLSIEKINVGESGLLARLAIPILSVLNDRDFIVEGNGTLVNRRLKGSCDIMKNYGVELSDEIVPIKVTNNFKSAIVELDGGTGSQIISGLITALALNKESSTLVVNHPKSLPYIFITLDILKKFGIEVVTDLEGGVDFIDTNLDKCEKITLTIKANQRINSCSIKLESDWSAASVFMVAAAIFGKITINGLDTKSVQADISILDILIDAGASLSEEEGNVLHVQKGPLRGFEFDANQCPDLFPILSVLAIFCDGISKISGVNRLANKESNRAEAILSMLTQMGVKAKIDGDDMIIYGENLCKRILTNKLVKGGEYSSYNDHRMVMALKVASLGAESPIIIDNQDCVSKSYPNFINDFMSI